MFCKFSLFETNLIMFYDIRSVVTRKRNLKESGPYLQPLELCKRIMLEERLLH